MCLKVENDRCAFRLVPNNPRLRLISGKPALDNLTVPSAIGH